jgi:hypothetical protein
MRLLEENIGIMFQNIGMGKNFLAKTPKITGNKSKNRRDYIKLNASEQQRKQSDGCANPIDRKKIFVNNT